MPLLLNKKKKIFDTTNLRSEYAVQYSSLRIPVPPLKRITICVLQTENRNSTSPILIHIYTVSRTIYPSHNIRRKLLISASRTSLKLNTFSNLIISFYMVDADTIETLFKDSSIC